MFQGRLKFQAAQVDWLDALAKEITSLIAEIKQQPTTEQIGQEANVLEEIYKKLTDHRLFEYSEIANEIFGVVKFVLTRSSAEQSVKALDLATRYVGWYADDASDQPTKCACELAMAIAMIALEIIDKKPNTEIIAVRTEFANNLLATIIREWG
jgi:hypothetical protein